MLNFPVTVNPAVLGAGGNVASQNALFLSDSLLLPTNTVKSFGTVAAVTAFFGAGIESEMAAKYFAAHDNSAIKPSTLLIAPYNAASRQAWLYGGSLTGVTLAQLQAITAGYLTFNNQSAFTPDLSTATDFVSAANLITNALIAGVEFNNLTCTWDAVNSRFVITNSKGLGSANLMTYDQAGDGLGALLRLTQATGATLSQGADADTPTTAMNNAAAISRAWVTFSTTFEPLLADKELFAQWVSAQNQRYAYVAWDTDPLAISSGTGVTFGEVARTLAYDTVLPISGDAAAAIAQGSTLAQVTRDAAAFICGVVAATDYTRKDGRVTACFRTQAGLLPTVIDNQNALNLTANGYSFYGQFANSVNVKNFFSDGKVSGKWNFLDSFAGQVYLNTNLQTAIVSLMIAVNSLPYNQAGYSLARAAMNDPISAAKNAGIIRTGVSLSASQIAQINQTAGQDISSDLVNNGFFLQILDPGAQARAARGTPIVNLWYTDGGAIQSISLASINVL